MKKEIYADLHNHTTASDGDLSPEKLVQSMKNAGVSVVGVTDHDTLKGIDRSLAEGERIGVKVLPGVEMSVRFKESFFTGTLHLLCYFSPEMYSNIHFRELLQSALDKGRGDELVKARVDEINKFFSPKGIMKTPLLKRELTFEEIAPYSPKITRRHIALALAEKHQIENPDLINQIISNDSPAYLPSGIDIESVNLLLERVRRFANDKTNNANNADIANRTANNATNAATNDAANIDKQLTKQLPLLMVLAHPAAGSFPGGGHYKEVHPPIDVVERLLPKFIQAGINGIEINYPGHIEKHREILREWARKHLLFITGGSDCHDEFVRPPGVEGLTKAEFERLPF